MRNSQNSTMTSDEPVTLYVTEPNRLCSLHLLAQIERSTAGGTDQAHSHESRTFTAVSEGGDRFGVLNFGLYEH